jgi:hypothetical protein
MSERLPPEFVDKYKMGRMIGEGELVLLVGAGDGGGRD